ncbi:hypothetical protein ACIRCZ_06580 [Leifsonia sp. NPDC102414]|uniref:hypothetical protein n=1 Tax=Leifsonia sp. NPDC102414 TaxID=3364124 RepID=UPI00381893DA
MLDQDFPADSTAEVLRAFSARSSLIGIEKERERSAMWIGEVDGIASKRVWLTEVRRDATWHAQPLGYRLRAITAVSIGTRYLRALAEVAGPAPQRSGNADSASG